MTRNTTPWLLAGALVASAALNVHQVSSASDADVPSVPAGPSALFVAPDTTPVTRSRPCCSVTGKLELTGAQQRRFASCCPTYVQQCTQLQKRVDVLVAELERELCVDKPDTQRIDQLADEIGKLRTEELKSRIQSVLLVRKTLTPSQLERLANCCSKK